MARTLHGMAKHSHKTKQNPQLTSISSGTQTCVVVKAIDALPAVLTWVGVALVHLVLTVTASVPGHTVARVPVKTTGSKQVTRLVDNAAGALPPYIFGILKSIPDLFQLQIYSYKFSCDC